MKKIKTLINILLISAASVSLVSCAKTPPPLSANVGYVKISTLPAGSADINPIRLEALRETALGLGAEGALAWRSLQINDSLQKQADYLDQVFNFTQLLLNNHVLPPVLVESDNSLHLADADTIRLSDKTYRIIEPAEFVTAAPNWRDYLWMDYDKPDMPNQVLLPQNQAEASVWNNYLTEGWEQGLEQANGIFAVNLNRLKRDYAGMVLYRQLLAQHMISSPYVAEANLGVTGNSRVLRIGDRVLRITDNSKLQPNSNEWQPVITK